MELSESPVKKYELGNYNVSQNQLDKIAMQ